MYEMSLSRTFRVPVARLFKAWSDPIFLQRWFCCGDLTVPQADVDFRVGGQYRIVMRSPDLVDRVVSGSYLEIVDNEKLVFSWQWASSTLRTEVEVRFRTVQGGSELTLLHRQFPDADTCEQHNVGWEGCFQKLADALGEEQLRSA